MASKTKHERVQSNDSKLLASTSNAAISVFYNGGAKGGTGKSTVTVGLVDNLLRVGRDTVLIETDTTNPDTAAAYLAQNEDGGGSPPAGLEVLPMEMETYEGFTAVLRKIQELKAQNKTVVINSKAGNLTAIEKHGEYVEGLMTVLGSDQMRTLWIINPYRDSLMALNRFLEAVPSMPVDVVMPKVWGEDRHYKLYNSSKLKQRIEANGGRSLMYPTFAFDQMIGLFVDRQSLQAQWESADFINKVAIEKLRREIDAFCLELLEPAQ